MSCLCFCLVRWLLIPCLFFLVWSGGSCCKLHFFRPVAHDALFFVGFVGRLVIPSFCLVGPVALLVHCFFLFGAEVRWLLMHPPPKKTNSPRFRSVRGVKFTSRTPGRAGKFPSRPPGRDGNFPPRPGFPGVLDGTMIAI